MSGIPKVVLNDNCSIPIVGLGTWGSSASEVVQAVKDAIEIGYRHIDCAHVYQNETQVGEGVAAKIADCVVKRDDLFITSKLWNTFHRPDLVRGACENTLKALDMSYVDLYLVHWPMAYKEGGDLFPAGKDTKIAFSDVDYIDTWKEMEKLVDDGLCKSIGVSNFNKRQLERLLATARIPPAVNQVECHPYLSQSKLMEYCKGKNIAITAYSPLGSPKRPWAKSDDVVLLEDPKVVCIAEKYNKTAADILLRYQVERGNIVIPKSVTKKRIASNINVFNFKLTADDMSVLNSLDCNKRFVPLADVYGHPHHPFEKDEY